MALRVDFENEKISKLLLQLSYPSIIAMLANASYNIIDGIYLGNFVGPDALGATNAVLPIQIFYMGIATMVAIGMASLVSMRLGEKKQEDAALYAGTAIVGALLVGAILVAFTIIFSGPLLQVAGAAPEIIGESKSYLIGIIIGWIYFPFVVVGNNLLRCVGEAKKASSIMLTSIVANIFLAPLFILVFKMGALGVGLSTSISQGLSSILLFVYYRRGALVLPLNKKTVRMKWDYFGSICGIGFSTFLRQSIGSLTILLYNRFLLYYGGIVALNAIGIVNKVYTLITLPIFGLLQGIQPLVGYNYGSHNYKRVKESVYKGIGFCLGVSSISLAILLIFVKPILGVFTSDPLVLEMARMGMYFVLGALPLISFQLVGTTVFQSFGKIRTALLLALLRQLLLAIPLLFILGNGFGLLGVWISFPLADILAAVISIIVIVLGLRNIEKKWQEEGIIEIKS